MHSVKSAAAAALSLLALVTVGLAAGCTPQSETAETAPAEGTPPATSPAGGVSRTGPAATPAAGGTAATTTTGDADLITAGKVVFASNDCGNCHAVNGEGGTTGPDLSKIGAETEHTTEWLIAHIKNPKAHNPNSPMPAYEGKINDKDLLALGAYLASLK